MTHPAILWLRRDLRLTDQPALIAALDDGPVIPVYVLDDESPGLRKMGGASRWWLQFSLAKLDSALREKGSRLILRRGTCPDVLASIAEEVGAKRVHAIRHYEPGWRAAERAVAQRLDLRLHDGNYLAPPGSVRGKNGQPYKIYTPFWRALCERMPPLLPIAAPAAVRAPARWPRSDLLSDWHLASSSSDWARQFAEQWRPGEAGASLALETFLDRASNYEGARNLPSIDGSSRLSPHLHFGEISPAQVWHAIADVGGSVSTFLGELGWRDYAQSIIFQFPEYGSRNGNAKFDTLGWRRGSQAKTDLRAWQRGETGYPIVDAGMRQLWATGWMHNRVRMIAASFLVKHLLIDWREGEAWFWDTLVDADDANNAVNWQWIAGTGIDANMFARIMAPLVQSPKFNAGNYIRRWVPELTNLTDEAVHDPDEGERRSISYPSKIIGHRAARERALEALRKI